MNAKNKAKRRWKTLTALIALGVMTASVTGCATNIGATDFCYIYKPIYHSSKDTPETVEQVTDNNLAWETLCE